METIVMSVGGSLIVPDAIDTDFLKRLKTFIEAEIQNDRRFIIIAGGGKTARRYQEAAQEISEAPSIEIDRIGITAISLNAHLLKLLFNDIDAVDINPGMEDWDPGGSSDLGTIQTAQKFGAKKVINLSNIDYVYTDNPSTNPDAEKIENISWADFRKLIPEEWSPGLSSPFDPIAAKEAEAADIEVANINGAHLEELGKYLNGENFVGTRIY